jgi:organic hydroperoxide reductase OsmC/OhrA
MSEHNATVRWKRESADFSYQSYNRDHVWEFESVKVLASAAPGFQGSTERVDPEQAFVAAISACHMLTFLAIAAKKRLVVDDYMDPAVGFLEKNAEGMLAVTRVILKPRVRFAPDTAPSEQELADLHRSAHKHCFIANSVKTEISLD